MFYKPNYCCNCGEKIERIEWNLLTSRRFCPVCSSEQRKYDLLPQFIVGSGILALVFGVGTFFGNSTGTENTSQPVRPSASAQPQTLSSAGDAKRQSSAEPPAAAQSVAAQNSPSSEAPAGPAALPAALDKKPNNGTTYYCGALTKKGTPCSRKVKAAGTRCFQHEGRPPAAAEN